MDISQIKFDDKGLVPAIVQDAQTGEVLMMAYMNEQSLTLTIESGLATYFSRSRRQLWKKGETSGHVQHVHAISYDCDGDTLLLNVRQEGVACHTGEKSCFHHSLFESANPVHASSHVLQELFEVIEDRKEHPKEGSYTTYLFQNGVEKIAKKVGEEASEVIIAAMKHNCDEVRYEVADLIYHTLVLLSQQGVPVQDIYQELRARR